MKRLSILFVFFALFLTGCHHELIPQRLAVIDSLITAEKNDSADTLLSLINEAEIAKADDRAHYNLLKIQTGYLLHKHLPYDSLLNVTIAYYQQAEEKEKLAECYYYKAVSYFGEKNYEQSMEYSKKAETLAKESNNARLHYKINYVISQINSLCGNFHLSLAYAKKNLTLAKKSPNKNWIAYAYYRMGLAYLNLGQEDDALYCFDKTAPYIKNIRESDRPYFLSNLSLVYIDHRPQKAKELLLESLSYKELTSTLEQLADICYDEGNQEKAYMLWSRALTVNDLVPKDNIIHNMLEYDINRGRTDAICERVNEIIAIKDSVISKLKNDTIRELQELYNHQVKVNAANELVFLWQRLLSIPTILLIIVACKMARVQYKSRIQHINQELEIATYCQKVSDLEAKKAQAELQITSLQSALTENTSIMRQLEEEKRSMEQEINELLTSRNKWTEEETSKVRAGILLYDKVENNEQVRDWPSEDYEKFFAYFDAINHQALADIKNNYHHLTQQNIFYLLLKKMKKDKEEISRIIGITKGSIRSIDLRIKKHLK